MKTKQPQPQLDSEPQEFQKLRESLKTHQAILTEAEKYRELQSVVNAEVETFANSGDLRDTEAVSAIAAKQLQSQLIEKRLASLEAKLADSDAELSASAESVGRVLLNDLEQIKNGTVEKVAQAMKPHFEDFQACRRQASQSVAVREVNARIHEFRHLPMNAETVALAQEYLSRATHILEEVEIIRDSLGGSIPSANELTAM